MLEHETCLIIVGYDQATKALEISAPERTRVP
jgi:hypothetical protein